MNRFESISDRALELASSVTGNVRNALPRAGQWLDAGAKLGVVKSGARLAGTFIRRNPAVIAAALAGAGLVWYAAHRRAKRAEQGNGKHRGAIEGSARRVEAKRVEAKRGDGKRRTTGASRTSRSSGTRAQRSSHT